MKDIDDFIDRLVKEKGFEHKDPEVVVEIKKDLMVSLEDVLNAMIMTYMPEDKLEKFSEVLDSGDQEVINSFIRTNIPDMDEKTALVLLSFKNSYLS